MTANQEELPRRGLRSLLGQCRRYVRRTSKRASRRVQLERSAWFGPLPTPEKWVFLVGCYNSGTTLLHDLLATHPFVGSMPDEGQFLTDQLPVPREHGFRRLWAIEPKLFWLDERGGADINVPRLQRQWGAHFNDPSRAVLLEKTPTNAARTRWLQAHFPNAHFIGIIRDGRAVAEGIRRKIGHDLELAARQWARSNEIMLQDFLLLERVQLVTYEQLTEKPQQVMAELLSFLSLPPLEGDLAERQWKIHEQLSEIRNMNERSLAALTRDDLDVVEREAGPLLRRFGYGG